MAAGKPRRMEVMVGMFFLLTIALLLVVVIFFAGKQSIFADRYTVRAVFNYVAGLAEGAPVRLAGLNIGTVSTLGITTEGRVEVTMSLRKEFQERIRANSVARIITAGLLGDKVMSITVGSPDQPVVQEGGMLQSEDPLELIGVIQDLRPTLKDLETIISSVAEITSGLDVGKGRISAILDNVETITTQVSEGRGTLGRIIYDEKFSENLYQLVDNARVSMSNMVEATDNLANFSRTLPSMGEDGKAVMANLRASTGEVADLLSRGKSVMDNFQEGSESFKEAFDSFSEIGRRVEASMDRVDEVLANIQETTAGVKEALGSLPNVMERVRGSLDDVNVITSNFKEGSASFKKAMEGLPDVVERGTSAMGKAEEALSNITEASSQLPEIARSGRDVINSAEELLTDVKRSKVVRGILAGDQAESSGLVIYNRRDTGYPR